MFFSPLRFNAVGYSYVVCPGVHGGILLRHMYTFFFEESMENILLNLVREAKISKFR